MPTLIDEELRIKVVTKEEYVYLCTNAGQYGIEKLSDDAVSTGKKHIPCNMIRNKKVCYLFGNEPRRLDDDRCKGIMLSYWGIDPLVTRLKVSYSFSCTICGVFGLGYGHRNIAKCFGPQCYLCKRYSNRPHPGPFVDEREIQYHEYRNCKQKMDLLASYIKKKVRELRNNVNKFAGECNPYCMRLQAPYQIKGIVTGGARPCRRKSTYTQSPNIKSIDSLTAAYARYCVIGYSCESHCDGKDAPHKAKLKEWKKLAKEKEWKYVAKFLESPYFSLATTCGYQFTYRTDEARSNMSISAFFAMDGLGLAMPLVDGIAHHFYASEFSHRTCVPLCARRDDGLVSPFNYDDNVMILAWGSTDSGQQIDHADQESDNAGGGVGGGGEGFWPAWIAEAYQNEEQEEQDPYVIPEDELGPHVI